jgi:hypothetical protein
MSDARGVTLFNVDVQTLVMELQISQQAGYVEFEYTAGNVTKKSVYKTISKTEKLFTVTFSYLENGSMSSKTIVRESDGATLVWNFAYDVDGNFLSKELQWL